MLDPLSDASLQEGDLRSNPALPIFSQSRQGLDAPSKQSTIDVIDSKSPIDPFVEPVRLQSRRTHSSSRASSHASSADTDDFTNCGALDRSAPMPIAALSRSRQMTPPGSNIDAATPTAGFPTPRPLARSPPEQTTRASQARLVCEACASGTLEDLKSSLPASSQAFTLANTPHPNSGLLPLHIAASRGSVQHCSYLLNECGALVDVDDPSGETALQKAALRGHAQIVQMLLTKAGKEIIESADNDGWTALMNAASKGYLDIVRVLVELGAQVDRQNKIGTALMCAASRGHSVVVRYLLANGADPLVRNQAGETAYDMAVANFEIFVAELLASEECRRWAESHPDRSYNPLALHINVAVLLHENQRLTGSRALSGGRAKYSSSALLQSDKRTAFTLPSGGLNASEDHLPLFRSDVNLPTADAPFVLPIPASARRPVVPRSASSSSISREALHAPTMSPSVSQTERSHFWISEWALDYTHPVSDPQDGWVYAPSFDANPEKWSTFGSAESSDKAIRYRRWVRVLRRRLDRPLLPLAGVDDDTELTYLDVGPAPPEVDQDYLQRARWQADGALKDVDVSAVPSGPLHRGFGTRLIHRLEAAVLELKNGYATEEDFARAQEANALLTTYERRLYDLQTELDAIPEPPMTPCRGRSANTQVEGDYFGHSAPHNATEGLNSEVTMSPSFRVPTRELPATPSAGPSLPPPTPTAAWQPDDEVKACIRCSRRFTMFLRKHHCRLCGRVVCASCSSHSDKVDANRLVPDPTTASPFLVGPGSAETRHRTCDPCHEELTAPLAALRSPTPSSPLASIASDMSELTECVVCGAALAPLGPKKEQEKHVSACLDRGSGSVANANRFIAFRLPSTSPINGLECEVCLEELTAGQAVARLACLCSFHETCARAWLLRGRGCPVHSLRDPS